jgi:hypothetical protein
MNHVEAAAAAAAGFPYKFVQFLKQEVGIKMRNSRGLCCNEAIRKSPPAK